MQARYQYGNLTLRKRKKGPDVWQFRWTENGKLKSVLIGTVEKLRRYADAERAVEHLRIKINAQNPQRQFHAVTVGALIERFMAEYAAKHCRKHTQKGYRGLFENHIKPRWGTEFVQNVEALAVGDWLEAYPHSRQVKSHVRTLFHILYQAALRWKMVEQNPIALVRQSQKRLKTPRALTPAEFKALLGELREPFKTMVITIACLGLRVSELLGLRWGDIDLNNLTVKIQRGVVGGDVNPTKTDASESALPLDPDLAEALLQHKARAVYSGDSDYVFAGATGKPPWKDGILADHLKPAATRAGIGNVGWHTFRHTYSTLLHSLGATPAVQKELLRHADIRTTLDVYTHAVSEEKREAASKVAHALWKV
ncbi:MAG: site-specific integrase [Acidobacteria bacterium]|jgi:integrase|nr:MAG: site-specific integrase [Acidobacteriota bacterium]